MRPEDEKVLSDLNLLPACTCSQVLGVQSMSVINASLATKLPVGNRTGSTSVASAAECQALVRKMHPTANAAEYSNTGGTECLAVFNA